MASTRACKKREIIKGENWTDRYNRDRTESSENTDRPRENIEIK